jgi:hypothetical protein
MEVENGLGKQADESDDELGFFASHAQMKAVKLAIGAYST